MMKITGKGTNKYGAKKVTVAGVEFDSREESMFYAKLLDQQDEGLIQKIELQPVYILQEGFTKNGKKYLPIKYVSDFLVTYQTGEQVVMDVKGFVSEYSKLKHKMFHSKYRDLRLELWSKAPIKYGGGYMLTEELDKLRKVDKKEMTKLLKAEIELRKKYEGFLRSVNLSGERLGEHQTFEWFAANHKEPEKPKRKRAVRKK